MVFSAWQKPVDCFVLVCAPVQRPGREMLQTQAVAEPGDLVPVVCEADYLLSSPPLFISVGKPGTPFAKKKEGIGIHNDIRGLLATILLA